MVVPVMLPIIYKGPLHEFVAAHLHDSHEPRQPRNAYSQFIIMAGKSFGIFYMDVPAAGLTLLNLIQ